MGTQFGTKTLAAALEPLRPNLISIRRRSASTPSATGARAPITTTLNTGVPALINPVVTGTEAFEVEGLTFFQDAQLFVDGLQPLQYAGLTPGSTLVVGGVTYTVAANGLGAYPDLARNDRIVDEGGLPYLVLAVARFYTILPVLQAKLAYGRASS